MQIVHSGASVDKSVLGLLHVPSAIREMIVPDGNTSLIHGHELSKSPSAFAPSGLYQQLSPSIDHNRKTPLVPPTQIHSEPVHKLYALYIDPSYPFEQTLAALK